MDFKKLYLSHFIKKKSERFHALIFYKTCCKKSENSNSINYKKPLKYQLQKSLKNYSVDLTHFQPMFHLYTPWKQQKTFGFLMFWFSGVFIGYKNGTFIENGLNNNTEVCSQNLNSMALFQRWISPILTWKPSTRRQVTSLSTNPRLILSNTLLNQIENRVVLHGATYL